MGRAIRLTDALRQEYADLWAALKITRKAEADAQALRLLLARDRYKAAGYPIGVPWEFVACVHMLESGQRWDRHLHNGDPLTARTVQIPKGRPSAPAKPPFSWWESATDALALKGLATWTDWSVPGMLYQMERYNGWGYRLYHPETLSPYLWAGSSHYRAGKYVADGKWSASAVSRQIGAAVLLRAVGWEGA